MRASVMYLKQTLQFATHVQIIEHTISSLYVNILIFITMDYLSSSKKIWLLAETMPSYMKSFTSLACFLFQLSVPAISGIF